MQNRKIKNTTEVRNILLLFVSSLMILQCSNVSIKRLPDNEFRGFTKRVINAKSGTILDSMFDNAGTLRKTVYYIINNGRAVVRKLSHFKNNIIDSTQLEYDAGGNLKTKRFYFLGRECFERIDFDKFGKISKYIFLSSSQTQLYLRLYDSTGKFYESRGTPFFECFMNAPPNGVFSERDTAKALFYVPTPPDCEVKLYTLDGTKEYNNILPINNSFIYGVKIYPLEKGNYEWPVKMKIFDRKTDTLLSSSPVSRISYSVE